MKTTTPFLRPSLVAAFLLASLTSRAQTPAWQSVVAAGWDVAASAADAAGNVYLAGTFDGTITLGSTTLITAGNRDIFVAKWSTATNSFLWARRAGGSGPDAVNAIAVSGTNVYVAGTFVGAAANFGATTLASAGGNDIFVAKLTDAGSAPSFSWAQRAGGSIGDYPAALAVSNSGVFLTGRFESSTATFGSTTLTSNGFDDIFVAKLTDAGATSSFAWVRQAGGPGVDQAQALAVNGLNVFVAGNFSGSARFGANTLTDAGQGDLYVTKLIDNGTSGSFEWATRGGSNGFDQASALAVSNTGIYVAGSFQGRTASFGTQQLTNAGTFGDVYVAKLLDTGSSASFVWAQRGGGAQNDQAAALAVNGSSVYVAGTFDQSPATFGSTTLPNAGGTDGFAARLTDAGVSGNFTWALGFGGTSGDFASSIAVIGKQVYVGGTASPPASFGVLGLLPSPSTGTVGFLASLVDNAPLSQRAASQLPGLSIYPNPARNAATVELPAVLGATQATLTLTDAVGRAVRTTSAALPAGGLRHTLDVSNLAPGLYTLRVQIGTHTATQPLAVE
ncbi:T9SS type A sorting domain-containing protein [Hymenobacter metallicola]|uniref:T9SS type A sorting domain-containing protein n=1 Tax=Hymenobacter metallicola TaxID=2563114 RepID=UPI0014368F0D|nr:T9SS type A sorting domain-containing protein [Hymenobacter metallicola]